MTTSSGYVVQPQVQIPEDATNINIAANGAVSVTVPGNDFAQEVGQISLVNFGNPRGLLPIGQNFLVESTESGQPQEGVPLDGGFGSVLQGFVEGSNVNVVQQLVDMIETQRAYEVSSKSITAVDEMMRYISNNL
jgi:flagellar basal-body rod protein FlgG